MLGIGALILGLAAILLGPIQNFILQTVTEYDLPLPNFILGWSSPTVFDEARHIRYRGSRSSTGIEHFQNIFYAEDTSGANRFAPPVPVRPAGGAVIDATRPGAWCPQATGDVLPFTSRVTNISENCLSLRIARPRGTKAAAGLPVMVWLHGGNFLTQLRCSLSQRIDQADLSFLRVFRWSRTRLRLRDALRA